MNRSPISKAVSSIFFTVPPCALRLEAPGAVDRRSRPGPGDQWQPSRVGPTSLVWPRPSDAQGRGQCRSNAWCFTAWVFRLASQPPHDLAADAEAVSMKRGPRGSSISAHTTRSTCSTASAPLRSDVREGRGAKAFYVGATVGQGRFLGASSGRAAHRMTFRDVGQRVGLRPERGSRAGATRGERAPPHAQVFCAYANSLSTVTSRASASLPEPSTTNCTSCPTLSPSACSTFTSK